MKRLLRGNLVEVFTKQMQELRESWAILLDELMYSEKNKWNSSFVTSGDSNPNMNATQALLIRWWQWLWWVVCKTLNLEYGSGNTRNIHEVQQLVMNIWDLVGSQLEFIFSWYIQMKWLGTVCFFRISFISRE